MKTNKFKVLLCCYTIGIAGCNKIGNPSYMDGGGDRKDDKKQEEEADFSVEQSGSNVIVLESSTIDHSKMLEDILRGMKEDADLAEECAVDKQKSVERAIQHAEHARVTAERLRKTADDTEKSRRANPIPGIDTFHQRALEDTLRGMKEDADLAEECAVDKQKAVERLIQQADHARITAERLRKTADDTEKSRRELGSGDASTSSGVTRKSVDDKEKESIVGLGKYNHKTIHLSYKKQA